MTPKNPKTIKNLLNTLQHIANIPKYKVKDLYVNMLHLP